MLKEIYEKIYSAYIILFSRKRGKENWPKLRGVHAFYKPSGMSSHAVVACLRRLTKEKRIGHGGTLDPLAEGVLVIGIGRSATKTLSKYTAGEKTYNTVVRLGIKSTTEDEEGEKTQVSNHKPTEEEVLRAVQSFLGESMQTPPAFSALKINGTPAYKLARKGKEVSLSPRKIHISQIILNSYSYPDIDITVTCSGGTYIRAIARDIGEILGTGAYMHKLIRTQVGEFTIEKCLILPKDCSSNRKN